MNEKHEIYMCPPNPGVDIAIGFNSHIAVKIPYRAFEISICFDKLSIVSDVEMDQRNSIRIYDLREMPGVDATEMIMGEDADVQGIKPTGEAIGEIMRRIDLVLMLESQEGFPKIKHIHNLDKKYLQVLHDKKPF